MNRKLGVAVKLIVKLLVLGLMLLVAIVLNAAEEPRVPVFQIRRVVDQPAADSEQLTQEMQTSERKTVAEVLNVLKGAVLDDSDVKSAKVQTDPLSGKPQVGIIFTAKGKKAFADVTRMNLNKRLAILIDGKVVMAPVIRTEIINGEAVIDANFTSKEAATLAERISKAAQGSPSGKMKPWKHGLYDAL